MKATKIKMKRGHESSNDLLEIDEIYITGCIKEGFYKKALIYDSLKNKENTIQVNISPFPNLIPTVSANLEKYVKSKPNKTITDNLLKLPRVKMY